MKERSLTGPICQAAACRNLSPPSVRGCAAILSSRGKFIMFQDSTGTNSVYTSVPSSDVPKSETLRRIQSRWGWQSPTKPQSSLPIRNDSSYVSIQSSLQGRRFGAKQLIPVRKTLFPVRPSQTQTLKHKHTTCVAHGNCFEAADFISPHRISGLCVYFHNVQTISRLFTRVKLSPHFGPLIPPRVRTDS